MSPTVFMWKEYRFFFFSREETRAHVHVHCSDGEVKIWLEPGVQIAYNHGLTPGQVSELLRVVRERRDEIIERWRSHFPS
jgi:hypothetical protein